MFLLPESAKHYKSRQSVDYIKQGEYDFWLMSEVGLCWQKLDSHDQWWFERALGKLQDSFATFAYNDQELPITDKIQYGGVGIVALSDVKHCIIESGKDTSGLARWVWIRIQGREGHTTRIVSAYRPCRSNGASTVFHQHCQILSSKGDHRDPLEAFLQDILLALETWQSTGDHLVIGMDVNEDVRTGPISKALAELGLREAILDAHSEQSPPATHNRNQNRQPIDGIWISACIQIAFGGYSAFGDACPSDHRALWINISHSVMFGQRPDQLSLPKARNLKTSDPRLIERYNDLVKQAMFRSGFYKRFEAFKIRYNRGEWSQVDYNILQQENTALRRTAEAGIRKLRMGGIQWSPKLQRFRNEIELWRMIVKRPKGINISVSRIRRFIKKTGLGNALDHDLADALIQLNLSYQTYKEAKKDSSAWRNDHLDSLAKAKAEARGTDEKKEIGNLISIEHQRRQARNVKRMNEKMNRNRVTQVFYTDSEGTRVVCDTQDTMVRACIKENESRFSQSVTTPPMTIPLYEALGSYG
jgi:hypothetical protein